MKRLVNKDYKQSLSYDSKGILDKYIKTYDSSYNPIINHNVKKYSCFNFSS